MFLFEQFFAFFRAVLHGRFVRRLCAVGSGGVILLQRPGVPREGAEAGPPSCPLAPVSAPYTTCGEGGGPAQGEGAGRPAGETPRAACHPLPPHEYGTFLHIPGTPRHWARHQP